MKIGRIAFLAGLALSVVAGFVDLGLGVWLIGGAGIITGLLNVEVSESKSFLLAGIGLVVAFSAILQQDFNPELLNRVVFFLRDFVAHVVLVVGLIGVFKTARN